MDSKGCKNKTRIEMARMIMIVLSWARMSKVRMKIIELRRGLDVRY